MAKVALLRLLFFCFLKATITFQWDYSTDSLRDGISAAEIKVLLGMKSIEAMYRYIYSLLAFFILHAGLSKTMDCSVILRES
ncbi:hypothetical protein [Bacillus thuringiensis]|uniref:hypothetical protein n=1 Tax=Bacillus thuringiensis TaxID=1428 RepID=UPI001F2B2CB6|nr:hypothetical protein [Bacillus thuringiensis]